MHFAINLQFVNKLWRLAIKKKSEKKALAVVSTANGEIFELEGYAAVGMAGNKLSVLTKKESIKMPYGSELMMLPKRLAIVYNMQTQQFETLDKNPFDPKEKIYPVAVFNSPGHVNQYACAYDGNNQEPLPLFSYGAVGFLNDDFRSATILVDSEPRQDLRLMPRPQIVEGVKIMQKKYPKNRLIRHIENCALEYGCPAGKNFFLKRFEAPMPTAQVCNANCLGCISLQTKSSLSACQDRISFTPLPEEIFQLALEHIETVQKAIVSFGQGCEGDPLMAFNAIEPAVKMIRAKTMDGTINMNTNASIPGLVEKLCNAGLDSIRVSMNSVQKNCYNAYFRPKKYTFDDVITSIKAAKKLNRFVSINYLNCPGFTDTQKEFTALKTFIEKYKINMIQWRNLNYDPVKYYQLMPQKDDNILGMTYIIDELSTLFPDLIHGYFNPAKEDF